jgi:hypothetical protein
MTTGEQEPPRLIEWRYFESDERIAEKLSQLVHNMPLANARFHSMNTTEVAGEIKQHIVSSGLLGTIAIRPVLPRDKNSRWTGLGSVSSPITKETIYFEF